MSLDPDPWSTRDEIIYWLQFVGVYTLLGLIAVVRFVLTVVGRVIVVGTSLVCIIAVLLFGIWVFTG